MDFKLKFNLDLGVKFGVNSILTSAISHQSSTVPLQVLRCYVSRQVFMHHGQERRKGHGKRIACKITDCLCREAQPLDLLLRLLHQLCTCFFPSETLRHEAFHDLLHFRQHCLILVVNIPHSLLLSRCLSLSFFLVGTCHLEFPVGCCSQRRLKV